MNLGMVAHCLNLREVAGKGLALAYQEVVLGCANELRDPPLCAAVRCEVLWKVGFGHAFENR